MDQSKNSADNQGQIIPSYEGVEIKRAIPFKNSDEIYPNANPVQPSSKKGAEHFYDNSFLDDQHFYLSNSVDQSFVNLNGERKDHHIRVQDLGQIMNQKNVPRKKSESPSRFKPLAQAPSHSPAIIQRNNFVPKLPLAPNQQIYNSRIINSSPVNTTNLTSQEDLSDSLSNIEYDKIEQESLEIEKRISMLKRKGRELQKGMKEQQQSFGYRQALQNAKISIKAK